MKRRREALSHRCSRQAAVSQARAKPRGLRQPYSECGRPPARSTTSRRYQPQHSHRQPGDERLSAPALHALRQDRHSLQQHNGLASAARRDGGALLWHSPWRPLSRIGWSFPAGIRPGTCPEATWQPRRALIRRSAGAAESVSTQVQDCQQPPASLLVEIVPPHHTQTSVYLPLGQPSMPPSYYKVQDSQALPPGRPSLGVRLTTQEINCFSHNVLLFLFIDYFNSCR